MTSRLKLIFGFFSFFYLTSVLHRVAFALDNWQRARLIGEDMWSLIFHYAVPADIMLAAALTVVPALLIGIQFFEIKTERWLKLYIFVAIFFGSVINTVDFIIYRFWGSRCDFEILKMAKEPAAILANFSGHLVLDILVRWLPDLAMMTIVASYTLLRETKTRARCRRSDLIVYVPVASILCFSAFINASPNNNDHINEAFFGADQKNDIVFSLEILKNPLYTTFYQMLPKIRKIPECVYPNDISEHNFLKKHEAREGKCLVCQNTKTPNIIVIIGESFSSNVIDVFNERKDFTLTPAFDRLAQEGILFTHFYANTTWTVGAVKALLAGSPLPVEPKFAPSLSKVLKKNGYSNRFYYGGDLSLFGLRKYLVDNEFEWIMENKDFPEGLSRNSWGIHDHAFFEAVANDLEKHDGQRPFFSVLLTLSNHEPFDVPDTISLQNVSTKIADWRMLRAVAYADDSLGKFVERVRRMPLWKNTMIVFMADHGHHASPFDVWDPRRYEIPMLWIGGAVRQSLRVDRQGAQSDLAATLLTQLGYDATPFLFSRDIFSVEDNFTFYRYSGTGNQFGIVQDNDVESFDCSTGKDRKIRGDASLRALGWSYVKALLEYRDDLFEKSKI